MQAYYDSKFITISIEEIVNYKFHSHIYCLNKQNKKVIIFAKDILSCIKTLYFDNSDNDSDDNSDDDSDDSSYIITNFQNKINILTEELNKKDELNKRLINTLMLYRYKEFDNTITYDYNEIKQKNKALNNEFKRVAKLMKLC